MVNGGMGCTLCNYTITGLSLFPVLVSTGCYPVQTPKTSIYYFTWSIEQQGERERGGGGGGGGGGRGKKKKKIFKGNEDKTQTKKSEL